MIDKSVEINKIVLSGTPEEVEQTPGNGKVWDIYFVSASLPPDKNVKAEILFGSTKKWSCHGNWPSENPEIQIVGDGLTILKVKISNDSGGAETCRFKVGIGEQEAL